MSITFNHELITPQRAKQILGRNAENNRRPKEARIARFARDMLGGNWNPNTGETIKVDIAGTLIDGQNRMRAVILAGEQDPAFPGVHMTIAYDVPTEAMQVIDSGAARSAGDALRIAGAHDRMRGAAIVRWSLMWDVGLYMGGGGTFAPTTSEIMHRYRAEAERYDAASKRATDCQNRGLGVGAPAGVAHYLFNRIDAEFTHQFFDQYVSGANLPGGSPVLALRNRMARVRVDRVTRPEQLALFVRSWNAFRAGESMDRIQIARGELTNDNFPQPK